MTHPFSARTGPAFPQLIVDYSKYHDVRVDNQLATGALVPDVVQLQTVQDFTRWKRESWLLHCKPADFSKLYKKFRDPDGAWIAYFGEVNGDPTPGWPGLHPRSMTLRDTSFLERPQRNRATDDLPADTDDVGNAAQAGKEERAW